MKRSFYFLLFVTFALSGLSLVVQKESTDDVLDKMKEDRQKDYQPNIILGYVTSWSKELPDPFSITHLSYAFATINDDFKSLTIKNEERFAEIVALKKNNPDLKVLLSIGGWGAGNFSEMAASESSRGGFIRSAMEIMNKYGIDGFDIDWEYPGSSLGKISSSKDDKNNFTLLIKQLRDSIGPSHVISFASPNYGNYYDYKALEPYVDFVNVMTYDLAVPPRHHSPLNHSELTGKICIKDVVATHYKRGVPPQKIILGIPFYGRGNEEDYKKFEDYRYIHSKSGTELRFDSVAIAPYIADSKTGELLISFDDITSIRSKCKFVKEIGIGGVMFWHYCGDTKEHELLNVITSELK